MDISTMLLSLEKYEMIYNLHINIWELSPCSADRLRNLSKYRNWGTNTMYQTGVPSGRITAQLGLTW
jgi:hypothetical protein